MTLGRPALPLATTLALALAAACDRAPAAAPTSARVTADSAEQVAFGVRHNVLAGGLRRAEVYADSARFFGGGNRVEMRGVRITFFGAAGDTLSTATARAASYDLPARQVTMLESVDVRARGGRQLTGTQLVYDATRGRLSTDGAYALSVGGAPRTGRGIELDLALREARGRR